MLSVLTSHIHHQNTQRLNLKLGQTIRFDLRDSCIDITHGLDFLKDREFLLGSDLYVSELSALCENARDVVASHGVVKESLENVTIVLFNTANILRFLGTQMIVKVSRNQNNHENKKCYQNCQVVFLLLDEFWERYTNVEVTTTIRIAELQKVVAGNWVS